MFETLTDSNFEEKILKSDKLAVVDLSAEWCGPCRMVGPVVEEIANETTTAKVGKVNVDEQPELAAAFKVMSIPTLIVMKDGKVVNTIVGARPKADIVKMLNI